MKRTLALLTLVTLPFLSDANAGPEMRQNRREVRTDRAEVRQDQRQMVDDHLDAQRIVRLTQAFDAAAATGQPAQVTAVDQRVLAAITAEINESNRELGQKMREAGRSAAEVGRSQREVGRDVAQGRPVRAADDRRDLRDDRRDAADDRRDVAREGNQNNRLRAVHTEYAGLVGRVDPPSLARKRALLGEVQRLAIGELREDKREIREDKRELREDKREIREDRRQNR